jgi:hypothetical protein
MTKCYRSGMYRTSSRQHWKTVRGDVIADERQSLHNSTRVPERVVGGSEGCTVGGVGDFGDEEGSRGSGESETETNQEAVEKCMRKSGGCREATSGHTEHQ